MNSEPLPALPPVSGARYVSTTEAADAYGAMGFRLPSAEVRCMIPGEPGKSPGAVFVWDSADARWQIESGGLSGKARREMARYQTAQAKRIAEGGA